MVSGTGHITTTIAAVTRVEGDLLEVRCHEGAKWTLSGIAELLHARSSLAQGQALKVLVVLPEELDFDMAAVITEHYAETNFPQHCRAEAWAVRNSFNEKLSRLYFSYYPSPVPSAICLTEEEARAWLEGK